MKIELSKLIRYFLWRKRTIAASIKAQIVRCPVTIFSALLSCAIFVAAQGYVDSSFNPRLSRLPAQINAVKVQPDQRILIGGSFGRVNGEDQIGIGRVLPNGNSDHSFSPVSIFNGNQPGTVNALAVQPDGRIVVAGNFTTVSGQTRDGIVRLNIDGTIDNTFLPITFNARNLFSIGVLSNGKILVGGGFSTVNGLQRPGIVRLNTDGTVDQSFSASPSGSVFTIVVLPDDRVLIGGNFSSIGSVSRNRIARLNTDGSVDQSFLNNLSGVNPNSSGEVLAIRVQSDGRILLAGEFGVVNGVQRANVARMHADGTLDTTFQITMSGLGSRVNSIEQMADGRVVIGGPFSSVNGAPVDKLALLTQSGTTDPAFTSRRFGESLSAGMSGAPFGITINDLEVSDDGDIIAAGSFQQVDGQPLLNIAKFSLDGMVNADFQPVFLDTPATITKVRVQDDGKIIVAGAINFASGFYRPHVVRLNHDGSLDKGFSVNVLRNVTVNEFSTIYDVLVQPDGKLILSGAFEAFSPQGSVRFLVRLNQDGSVDTMFTPIINGAVTNTALQADGKLIIGGVFSFVGNQPRNNLARLNADGSLDTSFNAGLSGLTLTVNDTVVQPDGKVVIAGFSFQIGGTTRHLIARLNSDGSLDPTLRIDNEFGQATRIEPIPGGFYIAGAISGPKYLLKISDTGHVDAGFASTIGGSLINVFDVVAQPDSKVLVAGSFSSINGLAASLARLNLDGTIDSSFPIVSLSGITSVEVRNLCFQVDGSLLVAGGFTRANSHLSTGLFRLRFNAPNATVAGRVLNPAGIALRNVSVVLTGQDGSQFRSTTSSFGTFQFNDIPTNRDYVLAASSKRYRFAPTQIVALTQNLVVPDIVGLE